jgi:hypothetical protein
MFRSSKKPDVFISIRQRTLDAIFDECDRFSHDETGGRIIGTYKNSGKGYEIHVSGVIGPGPNARRSPTSFFQDGEYQEAIFRQIEKNLPEIEHLGNWHTHHVNGLRTLSSGDKKTYRRIVSHEQHNTDFFYALLIVEKNVSRYPRYETKHYVFFRNDDAIHEVPESNVEILKDQEPAGATSAEDRDSDALKCGRVKDQELFSEFYPRLRPILSKQLGALCWKGPVRLVDGSDANIVIVEDATSRDRPYSVAVVEGAGPRSAEGYEETSFASARQAVINLERRLNSELYLREAGKK